MLKLHGISVSNYTNMVKQCLLEKGIEFEQIDARPSQEDEFLAISPMGKIPCLQLDDGNIIPESSIIIEYLDNLGDPTFIKGDADATRKIRFKDRMFDHYLNDAVVTLLFQGM